MNKSNENDGKPGSIKSAQQNQPQQTQQPNQPQHSPQQPGQQPGQKQPQPNQQHQQPQSQPHKEPKKQQQSLPSMDEIKGDWKQKVGAAKIAWGKLTEDEILKSEGHAQRLAGIVQERYAITRDEAEKQVKSVFEKAKDAVN